jgi:hypothetical protein
MKITNDKLEQALTIQKDGCPEMNCLQCQFITGVCRISKAFDSTSEDIKNTINQYLRKNLKN